jgi:hypothetical protein
MIIDTLIAKARSGGISFADLRALAQARGDTWEEVADDFARTVAARYLHGEYSWKVADAIINGLNSAYINEDRVPTGLAWEVYYAFDEGEYLQIEDPQGEARTKVLLAELSGRLGA